MKNFRSFLFALFALLIATACSNNPEDGGISPETQAPEGTALDPATCKFQWYEPADKLYEPLVAYDERCVVGGFKYLDEGEMPGCRTDETRVEYYKNGKKVAQADPIGDYWNRVYYSLFDAAGRSIFEARHDRIGSADLPEYIRYVAYDSEGREVDLRSDAINHYDGVVLNSGFHSYLDYGKLVQADLDPHDAGYFVLDDDGLFEGCEHHLYMSSDDAVVFPSEDEITNGGQCVMIVEHARADGKITFSGEYHPKYGEWWPSTEYEYDSNGWLAKKTFRAHHSDGGYYLGITTYSYDAAGRLLSIEEDKGKEGADGGDGVIEDYEHYTWNDDKTAIVLTQRTWGTGTVDTGKDLRIYDANGRVTQEDSDFDSVDHPHSRTIRVYDDVGRQVYYARFEADYDADKHGFYFSSIPEYSSSEEYDGDGHLVKKTDTDNYSWNEDGEQVSIRTYVYEGDRLVEERWSDSEYRIDSRTLYLYHCE